MKKTTNKISVLFLTVLAFSICAAAQTNKRTEKTIAEIMNLRRFSVEAIEKRDRQKLDEIYAEGFTHTHASGQVDDKKARLETFMAGEKTIDTAAPAELQIKVFNSSTAIAIGKSSVTNEAGQTMVYRWTVVYAKIGKKWRIAASQATKLAE